VPRDFAELQRQLEEALSKLKETKDHDLRRVLLAEMRLLLMESDRMNASGDEALRF
jgi:hypothetical protein